jgi:hypothetical protein
VTSVATAEKTQIHNRTGFSEREIPDCNVPVFLEDSLERLWGQTKIDVAGWAAFKRLVLLEK